MNSFTSRMDFPDELPLGTSSYCPICHGCLGNKRIKIQKGDNCTLCDESIVRVLVWDDEIKQYFDESDTLIHESVGIFLINNKKELLLFSLAKFPYGHTVPAGHIDSGEQPKEAAVRELQEELGIQTDSLIHLNSCRIEKDSCSRGSDVHIWDAYMLQYDNQKITLNDEGVEYGWFDLVDVPGDLTTPVRMLLGDKDVVDKLTQ